jgi:hypothetical protein
VVFNFAGLRETGISAASLTAIGAFAHAAVGWCDFASTTYQEIEWMSKEILPITLLSNPTLKAACLGDILSPQIRPAEV